MNAPASHLAALFKETSITYTVIGDQTAFIQALCVAAGWLTDNRVDAALVVSSEEAAWPMAAAVRHFSKSMVAAEGAGALLLSRESQQARSVALELVTDAHIYAGRTGKKAAAQAMRCEFPDGSLDEVLMDGRCGAERVDAPESAAWRDWTGARLSPRMILGEGLSAATAWQFAAAVHALKMAQFKAANISVVGGNEEAIGARLATW